VYLSLVAFVVGFEVALSVAAFWLARGSSVAKVVFVILVVAVATMAAFDANRWRNRGWYAAAFVIPGFVYQRESNSPRRQSRSESKSQAPKS
jgi:hypothetical protein